MEHELREAKKEYAGVRDVEASEEQDYSMEQAREEFAKSRPNSIAAQLAAKGKATMVQAIQNRYAKSHGPKK